MVRGSGPATPVQCGYRLPLPPGAGALPRACNRGSATLNWDDLRRELDLWAAADRVAAFWWRDDDAQEGGPALVRLLDLAGEFGLQIGLAVVPAAAGSELPDTLAVHPNVSVLQHGYRHQNHAAVGHRPVECGGDRPVKEVVAELKAGFRRLSEIFGPRFEPILAAPWNRIDAPVLARLPQAGYRGASAMGPRRGWDKAPGLCMANIHVDPLTWRGGPRFAGRDKALAAVLGELRARRTTAADPEEPLGILTHHRDHDESTWAFLQDFLQIATAHAAARWLDIAEVFSSEPDAVSPLPRPPLL